MDRHFFGYHQSPWSLMEPDALAQLQSDPAATVKRIQELSEQRTKDGGYAELCTQMSQFHLFISYPKGFSPLAWVQLAKGHELANMYIQLILSDGFFEENAMFVAHVFDGLAKIISTSIELEDHETKLRSISRVSELFQAIWVNREALKKGVVESERLSAVNGHPVLLCMISFDELHLETWGHSAGFNTYIPYVSLFGWLGLRHERLAQYGLAFMGNPRIAISGKNPDKDLEQFVRDGVIDGMGVQTFFGVVEGTLSDFTQRDDLLSMLPATLKIWHDSAMRPFLYEHDTLKLFVVRLKHFAHLGGLDDDDSEGPWLEWLGGLRLYLFMREDQAKALTTTGGVPSATFRGEDAIMLIAYGSRWIAQAAFRRHVHEYKDIADSCDGLAKELHSYADFPYMSALGEGVPDFIAGLVRGMREVWWPTLIALRTGRFELGEFGGSYGRLLHGWTQLGIAMGLDESWERKEMRKFCTHWRCQYNKHQPPNALSSCRGCGEARYCSKECQTRDWKVHKRLCGKRLK